MGRKKLYKTEEEKKAYHREYSKKYYENKKESIKEAVKTRKKDLGYHQSLYNSIKHRAKASDIPFNIELEDISIPEYCPILGIKLEFDNPRGARDSSPSVDRFYPDKGYVKGNVHVISFRANRIKNDSTIEELDKISKYIKDNAPKRLRDYIIV